MATFPTNTQLVNSVNTVLAQKTYVGDQADAIFQLIGASALGAEVIASGSITPSVAVFTVDTEASAASDDLSNILTTNLHAGAIIAIASLDAGRVVTVKHEAGGTGQITLVDGVDKALDTDKWLLLRRSGANWSELRFDTGGSQTSGPVQQKYLSDATKVSTTSATYVSSGIFFSLDNNLGDVSNSVRVTVSGFGGSDTANALKEFTLHDGTSTLEGSETCLSSFVAGASAASGSQNGLYPWSITFEHTPGTTTPLTYTLYHRVNAGTGYIGRSHNNNATAATSIIIEEF